jgi:hypothetical protein
MEPLWSPVVATAGNRSQMLSHAKARKRAETVAVGCHRLRANFHGKEGVDGSSPSEGLSKVPANPTIRVGVHDPGKARLCEAEVALDRRERDVDDRLVEDDHQHPGTEDDERQQRLSRTDRALRIISWSPPGLWGPHGPSGVRRVPRPTARNKADLLTGSCSRSSRANPGSRPRARRWRGRFLRFQHVGCRPYKRLDLHAAVRLQPHECGF